MEKERALLCKQLKKARKQMRMKQDQVARYLGIPVSAVSAMESGKRKVDALELYSLAQLYQKPLDWFFTTHPEVTATRKADANNPEIVACFEMLSRSPAEIQRRALEGLKGFLGLTSGRPI